MQMTRSYNLALHANSVKLDTARYTYERHAQYVRHWAGRLFFNGNKSLSTAGLGQLANQAQHKARGIISALTAAAKAAGNKTNVPRIERVGCPAKIEASQNSFDYWLSVESQFGKRIQLPVKSHRKLNEALRGGWILNEAAEFFKDRNGVYYARVYVQREVTKAEPKVECLGVDVGYRHGACDSDGHIGTNTGRALRQTRERKAQRQRQGLKVSGVKSRMKQLLDREAKRAVARCADTSRSLAVEAPRVVGHLGKRNLHGWAAAYFESRCQVLCKENAVWSVWVTPAYTSQDCAECGHRDGQNRRGISFVCVSCRHRAHADVNAARNISARGTASLRKQAIRNRERSRA